MLWLTLINFLILLHDILLTNGQAIDSIGKLRKRISNGDEAQLFEFPFQVAIRKNYDGIWYLECGGVLVAPDKVLTTYSCVTRTKPNNVRVSVGVLNMFGPPNQYEQTIYVSKIYRHESIKDDQFEVLGSHNIAVLTLITPAKLNQNVQIASLAENVSKYLETYETMEMEPRCKMSGWGYKDRRNVVPNTLQKASTRIVDNKLCQQWWPMVRVALEEGMYLCTMDMNVYESSQKPTLRGPCFGDGGTPLMCGANNGKLELVGLGISGTIECSGKISFQ
ncbi:transmembrane protease serine 11G [Biomphalaria pfeifferi]|uniref:Transmembrane protease serine 11G n=1 Tax=Biomphalaria pfeifferi TaxID=112525 RepID=A0AAD8CC10_BIOPF|nr:transmembrane protease serine 11G [Biomphalaria pfeifferi]